MFNKKLSTILKKDYVLPEELGHLTLASVIVRNAENVDEDISWTIGKSVVRKVSLKTATESIECLLDDRWSTFLLHAFTNRNQRFKIQEMRDQSNPNGSIVDQFEFAENYRFVRYREPKTSHWNTGQATFFIAQFKIGAANRCMVHRIDYLEHDSKFVWTTQRLIIDFVKEEDPRVRKIRYERLLS